MPAHPWRKPTLTSTHAAAAADWVQGKGRAGGGEGEEKQKDNQNDAKKRVQKIFEHLMTFLCQKLALWCSRWSSGQSWWQRKRETAAQKRVLMFLELFLIFCLVKSFTPARDCRRCRLAGSTYCFSNRKFLSFGWQTGKFSKLTKKLSFGWELNFLSKSRNIFVKRQSHPG